MTDEDLRSLAHKRIKARNDFYSYLLIWIAVSVVVTVVWALSGLGYFWPGWVIAGMGIAALFQAIGVFGPSSRISEQRIDAEVERLKKG